MIITFIFPVSLFFGWDRMEGGEDGRRKVQIFVKLEGKFHWHTEWKNIKQRNEMERQMMEWETPTEVENKKSKYLQMRLNNLALNLIFFSSLHPLLRYCSMMSSIKVGAECEWLREELFFTAIKGESKWK